MILDMKIICPHCESEFAMKHAQQTEEIIAIARIAARFGKGFAWVDQYLQCFKTAPDKPVKPGKYKLLLEELAAMVTGESIIYDRQEYYVKKEALFAAIRYVGLSGKFGFKNHNYLKKVAIQQHKKLNANQAREEKRVERERGGRVPGAEDSAQGFVHLRDIIGKIR